MGNVARRGRKKKTQAIETHRFKNPPSRLLRKLSRAGRRAGVDTEILRLLAIR
jgi:hypothetical protein